MGILTVLFFFFATCRHQIYQYSFCKCFKAKSFKFISKLSLNKVAILLLYKYENKNTITTGLVENNQNI